MCVWTGLGSNYGVGGAMSWEKAGCILDVNVNTSNEIPS